MLNDYPTLWTGFMLLACQPQGVVWRNNCGIRLEGATRTENIMVRLRAKAACDYALELNPELSTCYQSKVTKAFSFVGRVLLVARGVKELE